MRMDVEDRRRRPRRAPRARAGTPPPPRRLPWRRRPAAPPLARGRAHEPSGCAPISNRSRSRSLKSVKVAPMRDPLTNCTVNGGQSARPAPNGPLATLSLHNRPQPPRSLVRAAPAAGVAAVGAPARRAPAPLPRPRSPAASAPTPRSTSASRRPSASPTARARLQGGLLLADRPQPRSRGIRPPLPAAADPRAFRPRRHRDHGHRRPLPPAARRLLPRLGRPYRAPARPAPALRTPAPPPAPPPLRPGRPGPRRLRRAPRPRHRPRQRPGQHRGPPPRHRPRDLRRRPSRRWRPRIAMVGRLVRSKGIHFAIEALRLLRAAPAGRGTG